MAGTFTFASVADRFPVGTVVSAYPVSARQSDGPPVGAPVATSTVAFDSSLTFTDLAEGARFVAYALGVYVGFSTDAASGTVVSGGTVGPPGPPGPAGPPGAPGPAGQGAVAASDAVRGQTDRFYREVGAVLTYDGTGFSAPSDAFSRPQNVDQVTTDASKITVVHEEIAAIHLVDSGATVGENLQAVGISATTRPSSDLKQTDILLRQTRAFEDTLTNPGDGAAWVRERGPGSPFTVAGVQNVSADFPGLVNALANLTTYYRLSEASGAVLDNTTSGVNDGAVVSTAGAYHVTGGLGAASDFAIRTSGTGTNELTFPLAGVTQAAMSLILRIKMPFATKVAFRDGTTVSGTGYFVASDLAATEHIQYRTGTGSTFTTTALWSALADDQWHTLILTKNGANVALYLDGVAIHTASSAGSTAIVTDWRVGINPASATPYVTTLSEFASVSRAITATEARDLSGAAAADGILHVVHDDIGTTRTAGIILTPHGLLRPVLVASSVTATAFDVKFYDGAGAQVLAASAEMSLSVTRAARNQPVDPTDFQAIVTIEKETTWEDAVLATHPTLFARLGESSGTSFNDEVGSNDGVSTAAVTLGVAGPLVGDADTAVTLDGAQGKIAFANPGLTGAFSLGIWFKCTGAGSVGATDYATIIGWTVNANDTFRRLLLQHATGRIFAETGGQQAATGTATAPINVWHYLTYVWDGTNSKILLNGAQAASLGTSNITLNSAIYLGSWLGTSTSYSFKGSLDEFKVWDRALTLNEHQQLYVTGTDTAMKIDRSTESRITFRGVFETLAPPPVVPPSQDPPAFTALPAGDEGGASTSYVSLIPYRADLASHSPAWMHRALPGTQAARNAIALNGLVGLPNATSDNWRIHFCQMAGVDPTTGAFVSPTQGTSGNSLYMRIAGENIYVVSDTQPKRSIDDLDTTVSGWAAAFEAAQATLGGCPVPADALPHFTGDRYCFVYQPGTHTWWTLYANQPLAAERARTTIELTGGPSAGGFFLEFDLIDSANQVKQTFFLQSPVPYNCTAATMQQLLFSAATTTGIVLGSQRGSATSVLTSGGPLNVAPIVTEWVLAQGLTPVAMRFTNNFLNSGGVLFTYDNADAWTGGRLCSVSAPGLSGGHQPSQGTAAATHIDWLPMVIDWFEYQAAFLSNGDLGHVIPMSIGNAGTGFVFPATGGDGALTNTDGSKIKEGALMTFPLTADASKVSPEMMPIFRTIQNYGVIPIDKTGGGAEIIFRNWQWPGQTRPFPGPSTLNFQSVNRPTLMRQLPWHQLQIIDPAAVQAGW